MAGVDTFFEKVVTGGDAPQGAVENFFDTLGMMRGQMAPVKRAGFGFVVGGGIMWVLRPSISFNSAGNPLPLGAGKGHTMFPWWAPGLILGVFSGVFV